jgi:UDP-N-acetyl-2-amino-2-deoxyglucuronate dehydrogenase
MDKESVRIGVVGAGAIAPSHIHAIERTPGAELAAVCDQAPQRAAALAGAHGVAHYASLGEMLRAEAVDAITLCTPSGLHLETALEAVEAGKHLLVEKPMEITPERVDRIIAAAARRGVRLSGVFQTRFQPVPRRLKEMVDAGLLGEIYSGSAYIKRYRTQEYFSSGSWRGTWKLDGGGCLMNQGIHLVDLLLWFMGRAEEVIAAIDTMGRQVEVETLALGLVKFASGARGVIEGTTLAYPELPQYLEIFGSRGTLTFDGDRLWRLELIDPTPAEEAARRELFTLTARHEERRKKEREGVAPGTAVPGVDMGHAPVLADFVGAIRECRPPLVDGPEARRAVALIAAIYESGRNGSRPVRLTD